MFRDIDSLKEAGVPVVYDRSSKRYRIDGAHFLPPTNLSLEEALAIVLMADRLGRLERESILEPVVTAAEKIAAGLPTAMQERLQEVADAIDVDPGPRNPLADHHDAYRTLLRASVDRQTVRLRYDCRTEFQQIETELDPYSLLHRERSWYAIGHSSRHNEVRTFNVGRVIEAEPLGRSFERPKSFTLTGHLGNAWRMIPEEGPDEEVHLRFAPFLAGNVAEVLWHPKQRCQYAPDGWLDFYVRVSGLREIVWWVLGYGDQVEVVRPERLRRMVGRRLRAAAERYPDE